MAKQSLIIFLLIGSVFLLPAFSGNNARDAHIRAMIASQSEKLLERCEQQKKSGACNGKWIEKRERALEKNEKNTTLYQKQYAPSDTVRAVFQEHQCKLDDYTDLYGAEIQHCLQEEFTEIIDRSTEQHGACQKALQGLVLDYALLGLRANRCAYVEKASQLADFCWMVIDGLQGALEGVVDGACSVAVSVIHPIDSVLDATHVASGLFHVIADAARLSLDLVTGFQIETTLSELEAYYQKIKILSDACCDHPKKGA